MVKRLSTGTAPGEVATIARPTGEGPSHLRLWSTACTISWQSSPQIGRSLGGRDHTTVLHAVTGIQELARTDTQLVSQLQELRALFSAHLQTNLIRKQSEKYNKAKKK